MPSSQSKSSGDVSASALRTAVRRPISWMWLIFLWTAAFISFRSMRAVDGVGQAVCGVGFLLLGINAFLNPLSFNRPVQRLLKKNPNPSPMDAALAAGGPVLIIVGVIIRWVMLT